MKAAPHGSKGIVSRLLRAPVEAWTYTQLNHKARAVIRQRRTYLSPTKLQALLEGIREVDVRGVPGDVLEFGIALGGSSIVLADASPGRRFHGFDLFGQIPAPSAEKDGQRAVERYEVIAAGRSTGIRGDDYYGYRSDLYQDVCDGFAAHGIPVDGARVSLHQGLFEESWPIASQTIRSVAFAHIDCDWHDPVRYCLDAVAPLMGPGGIIVLDDYFDYEGCMTAVDAFLEREPAFEVRHRGTSLSLRRTGA